MAPSWEKRGDFMYFPRLDSCDHGVYTLGFRFTDKWDDPWTSRFNRFKARNPRAVRAACKVVTRALKTITVPAEKGVVVAAISSSQETLQERDPVWKLGEAVAAALGWPWRPNLLWKKTHRSLHDLKGGAAERDTEVSGVYKAKPPKTGVVLVVDDFATRGATQSEIARALSESTSRDVTVLGLALGKTERVNYEANIGISNEHIPAYLASMWDSVK